MPVPLGAALGRLPGSHLQRGEQRAGAVPDAIEARRLRMSAPHRQRRRAHLDTRDDALDQLQGYRQGMRQFGVEPAPVPAGVPLMMQEGQDFRTRSRTGASMASVEKRLRNGRQT